jgi:hypothetical protein
VGDRRPGGIAINAAVLRSPTAAHEMEKVYLAAPADCQLRASGKPSYCDRFVKLNGSGRNGDGSTCVRDERGEGISARWFGQSSFATHALVRQRNAVVDAALNFDFELITPGRDERPNRGCGEVDAPRRGSRHRQPGMGGYRP